jgi:hypothetical protein
VHEPGARELQHLRPVLIGPACDEGGEHDDVCEREQVARVEEEDELAGGKLVADLDAVDAGEREQEDYAVHGRRPGGRNFLICWLCWKQDSLNSIANCFTF